ncbi:hypothetical protein L596_024346 [Steinernema carpocapsae]|uniref:Uncharacterized protein n=1 Tax=Steinernema carpocapsae TaxID=34508 RepID=A0A4U5MGR5_STECR|nr:hypothetical protein L596_024346 [Steinernema carpocapsae]
MADSSYFKEASVSALWNTLLKNLKSSLGRRKTCKKTSPGCGKGRRTNGRWKCGRSKYNFLYAKFCSDCGDIKELATVSHSKRVSIPGEPAGERGNEMKFQENGEGLMD